MITSPAITVGMTMYNASQYLRECIDSVLDQTFADFEFIIVDDGSSDNSVEIVESYRDCRIRLIRREHDYIASLNCLLDNSNGRYIVKMDADDIMLPNRLMLQYERMELMTDVDVLGASIQRFDESGDIDIYTPIFHRNIILEDFVGGCCIAHPTVIMRRSSIGRFRYSSSFLYSEDYDFWVTLIVNGLTIRNMPEVVLRYRISKFQISTFNKEIQLRNSEIIRKRVCGLILNKERNCFNKREKIKKSNNLLTVIIPFLNEGEELINTVKSIRSSVGNRVDIIIINDNSTDSYPYLETLDEYDVVYIYNETRLGAAMSKEKGIRCCATAYFLLLDAHMRFYSNDWDLIINSELSIDPDRILCCQTLPLIKVGDEVKEQDNPVKCFGAYLTFNEEEYNPGIHWMHKEKITCEVRDSGRIPAILGAGYASSKEYWIRLGGLIGLRHYGCEEAFISLKAWLEGGGCYILENVTIGHIYRELPYEIRKAEFVYNYLYILSSIFPKDLQKLGFSLAEKANKFLFDNAKAFLDENLNTLNETRNIVKSFTGNNIKWVIAFNRFFSFKNSNHYMNYEVFIKETLNRLHVKIEHQKISPSLYNGAMGYLIVLMHYYNSYDIDDNNSKLMLFKCIQSITESIETNTLSYSMRDGLCGIGWGLVYLYSYEFIDSGFLHILGIIDKRISEYSPKRIRDYSLEDGLCGILCYVSARISLCRHINQKHDIDVSFLNELKEALRGSQFLMIGTKEYAQLLNILDESTDNINSTNIISIYDIVHNIKFIPHSFDNWVDSISNTLGILIQYFESLIFEQYEKK